MKIEKEEIEERIKVWLLNGVTMREIEDRLNWLGVKISWEDIEKIAGEQNKQNI
jgi:hypothetical protein